VLCDPGLHLGIMLGKCVQKHDPPHSLRLLRPRRERPRSCCAAKSGQEFSSFDVACHVTLRLGAIHAVEG
jgi:hypothetical protein